MIMKKNVNVLKSFLHIIYNLCTWMTQVLFWCSFENKILSYMYKCLHCTMYRSISKTLWVTRKIRSQFFVADEYHAWGKWRILLENLTIEQSSSHQLQMHYFQYFSFIKWEISNKIFLKRNKGYYLWKFNKVRKWKQVSPAL